MLLLLDNPSYVNQDSGTAPKMISFSPRLRDEDTLRSSKGELIEAVNVNLTVKCRADAKPSLDFFFAEHDPELDSQFTEVESEELRRVHFDIVIPISAEQFAQVLSLVPHGVTGSLVVNLKRCASAVVGYSVDSHTSYVWDVERTESLDISGSVLRLSVEWPL